MLAFAAKAALNKKVLLFRVEMTAKITIMKTMLTSFRGNVLIVRFLLTQLSTIALRKRSTTTETDQANRPHWI